MILLMNGPNLNLLGEAEARFQGPGTLGEIERMVSDTCSAYGVEVLAIQSNYEGALIDFLQEHRREAQGVIVNPGALAYSSFALHDCLRAMACPVIAVTLSSPSAPEESGRLEVATPPSAGRIAGLGAHGYYLAALWHCQQLQLAAPAGGATEAATVPEGAPNLAEDLDPMTLSEEIPMSGGPGEYEG
jgi:3-dehydroquinate dehydratase II